MPNQKKILQALGGATVFAAVSAATGGLSAAALFSNILGNIASNYFQSGGEKMFEALNDRHTRQGEANHDLQRGFRKATEAALLEIERAYCKGGFVEQAIQTQIKEFLTALRAEVQKQAPPFANSLTDHYIQSYLRGNTEVVEKSITALEKALQQTKGIDLHFQDFFCERFPELVRLYFCEILKDHHKDHTKVWKAYQKMLLDELQTGQATLLQSQQLTQEKLAQVVLELAKIQSNPEQQLSNALEQTLTSLQTRIGILIWDLRKVHEVLQEIDGKVDSLLTGQTTTHDTLLEIGATAEDILETVKGKQNTLPKFLTSNVFQPEVFIGRAADLQAVHDHLWANPQKSENLLLLVNGRGGIGKTTLAAKYYHRYAHQYAHCAWVFAEKSLSDALLTLALPLNLSFDPKMPNEERLPILLQKLQNLPAPVLLVIDNANNLKDLQTHYQALRSCSNCHLLLTTRITQLRQAATYRIGALSEQNAIALFRKYYPKHQNSDDALLKSILHAVGRNTLVVELLAKNLQGFNALRIRYQLQDLLQDLQNKGVLALSKSKTVKTDYHLAQQLQSTTPEAIIGAMYELNNTALSKVEKSLLAVFSVLPAENLTLDILEKLLPNRNDALDDTLVALVQKGWLDKDEQKLAFRISPVIQEVCRNKHGNLLEDCGDLVSSLIQLLKYEAGTGHLLKVSYEEAISLVRYAESVVTNLKDHDENHSILCERIGSFYNVTGNLSKTLFFYKTASEIDNQLSVKFPNNSYYKNNLAISYSKLGETHSSLGNLDKALKFFEEDAQLTKELYDSYPQNVGFKNGLAISYSKLGSTHSSLGNLDKALKFFEDETVLFEELYDSYPQNVGFKNSLAISYEKLGSTHSSLGNLDKALKFFEEDAQLTKELYESYPQNVGFKNSLAISYEKLGSTHSSLGNLDKALKFFEEDAQLTKELYDSYPQNVGFKNGLAISYSKLGSTHSSLGNLDKALKFFEDYNRLERELYESYPQNVGFKNVLALSYQWIGWFHEQKLENPKKAKEYYALSQNLLIELVESFPKYVEFQENLKWVENKLE